MKVSDQQYARSLYESLSGREEAEQAEIVRRFAELLAARRELGRAEAIISAFKAIWEKENGELSAQLVTARSLPAVAQEIDQYLRRRTGAEQVRLQEATDPEMVGGFILRYRDKVLDASLKTGLINLQDKLGS